MKRWKLASGAVGEKSQHEKEVPCKQKSFYEQGSESRTVHLGLLISSCVLFPWTDTQTWPYSILRTKRVVHGSAMLGIDGTTQMKWEGGQWGSDDGGPGCGRLCLTSEEYGSKGKHFASPLSSLARSIANYKKSSNRSLPTCSCCTHMGAVKEK